MFILHGGGPSTKETSEYLHKYFISFGLRFVSFDFSGQGNSSGSLENSSLQKRLQETIGVIDHLNVEPTFLIGTSMGGYIAMKLLEHVRCENLILFCPAAYSTAAWDLKFGHGFTQEIRSYGSYLDTDIRKISEDFKGNVLLFFGSEDSVIPFEIQEMYRKCFKNAKSMTSVTITDCPHPIHRWIQTRLSEKSSVEKHVEGFVRNWHLTKFSS